MVVSSSRGILGAAEGGQAPLRAERMNVIQSQEGMAHHMRWQNNTNLQKWGALKIPKISRSIYKQ